VNTACSTDGKSCSITIQLSSMKVCKIARLQLWEYINGKEHGIL
jgi:hypothetical protein